MDSRTIGTAQERREAREILAALGYSPCRVRRELAVVLRFLAARRARSACPQPEEIEHLARRVLPMPAPGNHDPDRVDRECREAWEREMLRLVSAAWDAGFHAGVAAERG